VQITAQARAMILGKTYAHVRLGANGTQLVGASAQETEFDCMGCGEHVVGGCAILARGP